MLCLVTQSRLTLCDSMNCSPPGSSVHGDSPGKNIGVGCHALFSCYYYAQKIKCNLLAQSHLQFTCIYLGAASSLLHGLSLAAASRSYSPVAVRRLLIAVAPLAVEQGLWGCQAQQLWCLGLVALWHVGYSQTRHQTRVPYLGGWILNHWTTREVPVPIQISPLVSKQLFVVVHFLKILFIWLCQVLVAARGILLPDQGTNLDPLHWECAVLATGPPGKSLQLQFF